MPAPQYTLSGQIKRQRSENDEHIAQPVQLMDGYRTAYHPTSTSTASFVGQPNTQAPPSIFGSRYPNPADDSPTNTMDARRWPSYSQSDRIGMVGEAQGYRVSMDIPNAYLLGQSTHNSTQYAATPSNSLPQNTPGMHTPVSIPEAHNMNSMQSRGYQPAPSPVGSAVGRPPLQHQYSQELHSSHGAYGQSIIPLDLQSPDDSYPGAHQGFANAAPHYPQNAHLTPDQTSAYPNLDPSGPPPREVQLPIRSESAQSAMPTLNSSVYHHQFPPQPGGPAQAHPQQQYPPNSAYRTPQHHHQHHHASNSMHKYDGR